MQGIKATTYIRVEWCTVAKKKKGYEPEKLLAFTDSRQGDSEGFQMSSGCWCLSSEMRIIKAVALA